MRGLNIRFGQPQWKILMRKSGVDSTINYVLFVKFDPGGGGR